MCLNLETTMALLNEGKRYLILMMLLSVTLLAGCDSDDDDDEEEIDDEPVVEEVVYEISPPEWMLGMWGGTATDGTEKVAIFNIDDISFGDVVNGAQLDITSFASIALIDENATFEVIESTDSTYSYTISFNDGTDDIQFTDTYVATADESVEYTFEMGGEVIDQFILTSTPAAQYIAPPEWLRSRWTGLSSDEVTEKAAIISPNNILFGDIVEGVDELTDFAFLLSLDENSTFQVLADDGATYSYKLSFDAGDGLTVFTDTYTNNQDGTLAYEFSMGGEVIDSFAMNYSYYIATPAWLQGMWQGPASSGSEKVVAVDTGNVSFGDVDENGRQQDVTPFNTIALLDPMATFTPLVDDGTTYSYRIAFNDGTNDISFEDTFVATSDTTVEYTFEMGGAVIDQVSFTKSSAAQYMLPSEWLNGMWQGAASDGVDRVAIMDTANISFGDVLENGAMSDVTSFDFVSFLDPNATFVVSADDGTSYTYTLTFFDGEGYTSFTDTYTNNGDDTLTYTFVMGGATVDSFAMSKKAAQDFIVPPTWLQGTWNGESSAEPGVTKQAVVTDSNVSFGDVGDLTDFGLLLSFDPTSTFRVTTDDGTTYQYIFSADLSAIGAGLVQFTDTYISTSDSTLDYTFEMGGETLDEFSMTKE